VQRAAEPSGWLSPLARPLLRQVRRSDWRVFGWDCVLLLLTGWCGTLTAQLTSVLVSRLGAADMAGNSLLVVRRGGLSPRPTPLAARPSALRPIQPAVGAKRTFSTPSNLPRA
jgi:hypothetical protein